MLNQLGRQMGVSLPEGQGQERIAETNKVIALGKPIELRPLQYSDEYGRVHLTLVYVTNEGSAKRVYFYPPTEEAVKGWRQATKRIKEQIDTIMSGEVESAGLGLPAQDTVDIVAQDMAMGMEKSSQP
jgi:hypothetical protein